MRSTSKITRQSYPTAVSKTQFYGDTRDWFPQDWNGKFANCEPDSVCGSFYRHYNQVEYGERHVTIYSKYRRGVVTITKYNGVPRYYCACFNQTISEYTANKSMHRPAMDEYVTDDRSLGDIVLDCMIQASLF